MYDNSANCQSQKPFVLVSTHVSDHCASSERITAKRSLYSSLLWCWLIMCVWFTHQTNVRSLLVGRLWVNTSNETFFTVRVCLVWLREPESYVDSSIYGSMKNCYRCFPFNWGPGLLSCLLVYPLATPLHIWHKFINQVWPSHGIKLLKGHYAIYAAIVKIRNSEFFRHCWSVKICRILRWSNKEEIPFNKGHLKNRMRKDHRHFSCGSWS